MNIFKMSDEEFEEYLKEHLDNIDPVDLLKRLKECGLNTKDTDNDEVMWEWPRLS